MSQARDSGMLCTGSDEAGMQVFVDDSTGERGWRTTVGPNRGRSSVLGKGIWAWPMGRKLVHVYFSESILAEQGETG